MERVFVQFEYAEKKYLGCLESVCGAGAMVYYLMVNRFYWGKLRLDVFDNWVLDTNQKGLEDMAGEFGYCFKCS